MNKAPPGTGYTVRLIREEKYRSAAGSNQWEPALAAVTFIWCRLDNMRTGAVVVVAMVWDLLRWWGCLLYWVRW